MAVRGLVSLLLALAALLPLLQAKKALFHLPRPDQGLTLELLDRFDVWGRSPDGGLDVYADEAIFQEEMRRRGVSFALSFSPDAIEDHVTAERERLSSRSHAGWFEEYHTYNETYDWYQGLARQFPDMATFVPSIGKTWEGRDLFALRVASPVLRAADDRDTKKAWIQCNIHAREWITNAACQYFINTVLSSPPALLDSIEIVIIPIVNPDGYEYTWTNDRMWRKNRRNNGGSFGVDLNRNFDQQWGGTGSSGTPASDTYRGPSAGSEPETKALSNYFNSLSNVVSAIDMHSYSQYLLRPFTHTNQPAAHEEKMASVSQEMAEIIASVHGKKYTPGVWYTLLYPSSGVAQDYYFVRGSYAMTIELRPVLPVPGFVLPPEEIIPTGQEVTPAILHFLQFALENPQ